MSRMKMVNLVGSCTVLLSIICHLYIGRCDASPTPDFIPREKSEMTSQVIHSDELSFLVNEDENVQATLVSFSAPWCAECQALQPTWDAVSREFDHYVGVRVVTVDCSGSGERACALHRIVSLPWIASFTRTTPLLLAKGGREEEAVPEAYLGNLEKDEIRSWALAQSPRLTLAVAAGRLKREPVWPSEQLPGSPSSTGALCVAWRASKDCDPEGAHDEARDLSCRQPVLGNRAGYCDCGKGRTEKLVDCGSEGRAAFTCLEECSPVPGCESWRATRDCVAGTARQQKDSQGDVGCRRLISSDWSGFCDCGGGLEAAASNCTHAPFTCAAECSALRALRLAEETEANKERAGKRAAKIAKKKAAQVLSMQEQADQEVAAANQLKVRRRAAEEAAEEVKREAARIAQEAIAAAEAAAEAAMKREEEEKQKVAVIARKKREAGVVADFRRRAEQEKKDAQAKSQKADLLSPDEIDDL